MEEAKSLLPRAASYTIQPSDSGKSKMPRLTTVTYSCAVLLMGSLMFGFAIGYSSPVISDLSNTEVLSSSSSQGIFSALMPIGAMVGAPIAGWLVDYIGRKPSTLLSTLPLAVGWLLTIISCYTEVFSATEARVILFAGRFVVGFGVGIVSLCIPLFITEIAPSKVRGLYGASHQLAITIGVFLSEIIGTFLHYYWLVLVPLLLTLGLAILTISLHETPRWLMSHNKASEARNVLLWLRGSDYDVTSEQRGIEEQLKSEEKLSFSDTMQEFKLKPVYYPFILALCLMFFQQFSGINAVIFNAEDIFTPFAKANSSSTSVTSPGFISSLCVGLTQVVATFIGVILTDLLGRRILLITGALIMSLSIGGTGVYSYLHENGHDSHGINALGITGVICYIIGFSIGWGALPWLMTSEIIPLRVKGTGVGIATFVNWSFAAIVTGAFSAYQETVHSWGAFFSFAVVCFGAMIFVAIFIPETKQKSLEEIEKSFEVSSRSTVDL